MTASISVCKARSNKKKTVRRLSEKEKNGTLLASYLPASNIQSNVGTLPDRPFRNFGEVLDTSFQTCNKFANLFILDSEILEGSDGHNNHLTESSAILEPQKQPIAKFY